MVTPLTLLHVSDVHFVTHDEKDAQHDVTSNLIKAVAAESWKADACIFSGDLSYRADSEELEIGAKWLTELSRYTSGRLFIVPGNHDIQRSAAPSFLAEAREDKKNYSALRGKLASDHGHFGSFQEWHGNFSRTPNLRILSDWSNPFGCASTVDINDRKVHLIGLNTATLSFDDDDSKKLIVDLPSLRSMLRDHNSLEGCTIAIGHHPISWLADWNAEEFEKILMKRTGAHIYLHGHQHDQTGVSKSSSTGSSLAVLECGAAYQNAKYPQYFAFYRLLFDSNMIEYKIYTFSDNAGEWRYDSYRSGQMVAELSRSAGGGSQLEGFTNSRRGPIAATAKTVSRPEEPDGRYEAARIRAQLLLQQLEIDEELLFVPGARQPESDEARSEPGCAILGDRCVFRLITQLRTSVAEIMKRVLNAVAEERESSSPSLRLNSTYGITMNAYRDRDDPVSLVGEVEAIVRQSGFGDLWQLQREVSGSSSLHIVVDVEVGEAMGEPAWVPVEFQIASAMEEIWGRFDYKFRYGGGHDVLGSSSRQLHLNALKHQFDSCILHLDLIEATIGPDSIPTPKDRTPSLARPDQILAKLKPVLPLPVLERMREAYELWKQADQSRQFGGSGGAFRKAAKTFDLLLSEVLPGAESKGEPKWADDLRYAVRMEEAYLLSALGDATDTAIAVERYQQILADRPEDVAAMFRLGDCLRVLGKRSEAMHYLGLAIERAQGSTQREFYPGEREFILDRAPLSLALVYFREFEAREREATSEPQTKERLELIRAAIGLARQVYEHHRSDEMRLRGLNDFLYYAWEEWRLLSEQGLPDTLDRESFARLSRELGAGQEQFSARSYEYDDTLARLHLLLGEHEKAAGAACRVRDWLERAAERRSRRTFSESKDRYGYQWLRRVSAYLRNDDERDALVFAMDICNRQD